MATQTNFSHDIGQSLSPPQDNRDIHDLICGPDIEQLGPTVHAPPGGTLQLSRKGTSGCDKIRSRRSTDFSKRNVATVNLQSGAVHGKWLSSSAAMEALTVTRSLGRNRAGHVQNGCFYPNAESQERPFWSKSVSVQTWLPNIMNVARVA
jgi:hypothetical protein